MQTRLITGFALLVGAVGAQVTVVPPGFASNDAPTLGGIAGFVKKQRQQVVIAEVALSGLRGRTITHVGLRRDGQYQAALQGGRADVLMRMATTTGSLESLAPDFAANLRSAPAVVFQGQVALPSSPQLAHRNEPTWSAPHAVEVPLGAPYAYVADHLVIDIAASPDPAAAAPWWPVDFAADLVAGTAVPIGTACGLGNDLGVAPQQLVVGSTARFVAGGPPAALSALVLAASRVPPLDLTFLGAPGCSLHVLPLATLSAACDGGLRGSPGSANHLLHLPPLQSLLGGTFATQAFSVWVDAAGAHLAASRALDVGIAASLSGLPGATIDSVFVAAADSFPATGRVRRTRMPVVRLTYE